uniref:Uncharacterized protein n=1 Tax=Glossina palpalis gambiensis TaxID=67801 RepID=A0A1B0B4C2_9MUSC
MPWQLNSQIPNQPPADDITTHVTRYFSGTPDNTNEYKIKKLMLERFNENRTTLRIFALFARKVLEVSGIKSDN